MSTSSRLLRALGATAVLATAGAAQAATVNWTDWTSFTGTAASGTVGGVGVTVSSTAAMNGVTQIGGASNCGGPNYWTEPNAGDKPYTGGSVSNGPTACEQLGLNSATTITLTFASQIDTLYLALLSVGQPNLQVTYNFDQAFTIDSEGQGYWGNDPSNGVVSGNSLTMTEFHGLLKFNGPVSSLTFTTGAENWQAFTVGTATVPEPSSWALAGLALVAAGAARRRRA